MVAHGRCGDLSFEASTAKNMAPMPVSGPLMSSSWMPSA
jgi:hypothetical protein